MRFRTKGIPIDDICIVFHYAGTWSIWYPPYSFGYTFFVDLQLSLNLDFITSNFVMMYILGRLIKYSYLHKNIKIKKNKNKNSIINNIRLITSLCNHLAKDLLCSFSSNAIRIPGFSRFKTCLCRLKQCVWLSYFVDHFK